MRATAFNLQPDPGWAEPLKSNARIENSGVTDLAKLQIPLPQQDSHQNMRHTVNAYAP